MIISIIGLGTIGSRLAFYFAKKGIKTICVTKRDKEVVKQGILDIIKRRGLDHTKFATLIHVTNEYKDIYDSSFVIDATTEDYELKKRLYQIIKKNINNASVIASTTSSLDLRRLKQYADPVPFIGLHFFNPPDKMKLVELSYDDSIEERVVPSINRLKSILNDKCFIKMPIIQGYAVNRILFAYLNSAFNYHLETGMNIQDIDKAMELGSGVPMGPFRLSDFIGNDITLSILETFHSEIGGGVMYKPSDTIVNIVREGRLGRKNNRGFYEY